MERDFAISIAETTDSIVRNLTRETVYVGVHLSWECGLSRFGLASLSSELTKWATQYMWLPLRSLEGYTRAPI